MVAQEKALKPRRLPPGVYGFEDHDGNWRVYLRRVNGRPLPKAIAIPGVPWSADFMAAIDAAKAGQPLPIVVAIGAALRTKAGSFNEAVVAFYEADAFTKLGDEQRKRHRQKLDKFRQEETESGTARGEHRLTAFTTATIDAIMKEIASPHARRHLANALRALFRFCVKTNRVDANPMNDAEKIELPKSDGFKPWDETHVEQFRARWSLGTMERLAFEIMLNTGLRRGDAIRLGRQHLKAGRHEIKPAKTLEATNVTVKLQVLPDLQAAIDAMPARDTKAGEPQPLTYLLNESGRAFTKAHFGQWFARACNAAGLSDVRAHGLRKCITLRLIALGKTPHEIGAIIGDKDLRVILRYCEQYDRERAADRGMGALAGSVQ